MAEPCPSPRWRTRAFVKSDDSKLAGGIHESETRNGSGKTVGSQGGFVPAAHVSEVVAVERPDQAVQCALFPSYVFVQVSDEERVRVLQTAGVVSFISMAGRPSPLREEEVQLLQECTARPREFEPHPFLCVGQRVKVKHGPFKDGKACSPTRRIRRDW